MKNEFLNFRFNTLKDCTGLFHGTSSRFFQNRSGELFPLMLGKGVEKEKSEQHRQYFFSSLGIKQRILFSLNQIHSDRIFSLGQQQDETAFAQQEGDAIITNAVGRPIGVFTADCVPVTLYDPVTHSAGVVHAGRRGTEQNIVSKTIKQMIETYGVEASNLKVGLGPSIGPCCYEVEESCLEQLKTNYENWEQLVRLHTPGKCFLDLWEANRLDALSAQVPADNIEISEECTLCRVDRWYSYRKEGNTGRMLTVVMLVAR